MRRAFIDKLVELATVDARIALLTGDVGYMALEPFRDRFPKRFFNMGVAEQNMLGVATGLADAGLLPFVYSIAPFASLRPLEFIRNGPVLHRMPVRIVGVGMGFEYGPAGPSHYGTEDIGVLRTLPGLRIVIPADGAQAATALEKTWNSSGPTYYSLGKDDALTVAGLNGEFEMGRIQVVRNGRDLALVTMGSVASEAVLAAEQLSGNGIDAAVIVVSGFHPDPVAHLVELAGHVPLVVTVEAHTISGGLGSWVGMTLAESGAECRFSALGVRESPDGTSGPQRHRWKKYGLDSRSIAEHVRRLRRSE
jgi:transketolase